MRRHIYLSAYEVKYVIDEDRPRDRQKRGVDSVPDAMSDIVGSVTDSPNTHPSYYPSFDSLGQFHHVSC